jgi:leader peptidase (prepilin peptidase)/N-methyltransferase
MTAFVAIVCGLVGLVIGSFLNVVVWRVPRRESIAVPASHCPVCDAPLKPYENIPIASWLALRAKCRHCDAHISARYPAVELLTGVLFVLVGLRFADSWVLPAYLVFSRSIALMIDLTLTPTSAVSGRFHRDPLLFAGALVEASWATSGALLGGTVALPCSSAFTRSPARLAFGDVRLSFLLGCFLAYLSWWHLFFGLFAGFIYGAVIGVLLLALGRRRRAQIPFGPSLLPARSRSCSSVNRSSICTEAKANGQPAANLQRRGDRGDRIGAERDEVFNTGPCRADIRLVRRSTIDAKGLCRVDCGSE